MKAKKELSVYARLLIANGVLLAAMLLMGTIAFFGVRHLNSDVGLVANDRWPKTVWVNNILDNANKAYTTLQRAFIDHNSQSVQAAWETIEEVKRENAEWKGKLDDTITSEEGKRLLGVLETNGQAYYAVIAKLQQMVEGDHMSDPNSHEHQAARAFLANEVLAASQNNVKAISNLVEFQSKLVEDDAADSLAMGHALIIKIMALLAFAVVVTVASVIWLIRSITGPLSRITEAANGIALGDLNVEIPEETTSETGQLAGAFSRMVSSLSEKARVMEAIANGNLNQRVELASERDVVGKSLETMLANLNEALSEVTIAAEQSAAGANQITGVSQSLSQGATEQAASFEEITSAMTQISSQAQTNSKIAEDASTKSKQTRDAAETGQHKMASMVDAMTDINSSSQQIAKIIKAIDDIAFQTNLLALNAAVEAARAGSHGKGFAVVADEVRNLAGRSAKAAKETAELIEGASRKVENGLKVAEETSQSFDSILSGIVEVTQQISDIATSSQEQNSGVREVSQGLEQSSQVTQETSASAEETASAAEELSAQSEQLKTILSRFQLVGDSSGHAAPPRSKGFYAKTTTPKSAKSGNNGHPAPKGKTIQGNRMDFDAEPDLPQHTTNSRSNPADEMDFS